MKKTLKLLGAATLTILLGALGSGLWTILQTPLAWCGRSVLTLLASIFTGFRDSVYQDVAKGFHDHAATQVHSMLAGTLVAAIVIVVFLRPLALRRLKTVKALRSKLYWAGVVYLVLFAAFLSPNASRLLTSIELLAISTSVLPPVVHTSTLTKSMLCVLGSRLCEPAKTLIAS